ncbi:MAG: hypothetical protein QOH52_4554 [Pseudonocardiales bacterium]|nr:hypothetical protein [Pseudonocardiales bacterium]
MRNAIHALVATVIVVHGLTHLFGAAKGLGWAQVDQLKEPISSGVGALWLVAAALVITAGVLLGIGIRWWWVVGGVAFLASQAAISTSWAGARIGTVGNAVLLAAVVYGYASEGPRSYRAEYRRLVAVALAQSWPADVVTEADLVHLPALVAAYVRHSGAVGQPRVTYFRARVHGRIRAGATKPWMRFTGEQVNTFSPQPSRLFSMDAAWFGLPVDVLHVFRGQTATMRVKAASIVPMVDAAGPEMDRGETVTLFNDLCLLAPAAIIDAPVTWHELDERRVRGDYTCGANTVTAELTFNEDHDLVDFVSDDRLRASVDAKSFIRQRWSTPVHNYQQIGPRRLAAVAEAHWHASEPEGEFAYVDLHIDHVDYNLARPATGTTTSDAITVPAVTAPKS